MRYGHNSDKWGEHIGSPLPSVMSIFVGTDLCVCPIVIIFGYFVIMTKPQLNNFPNRKHTPLSIASQFRDPTLSRGEFRLIPPLAKGGKGGFD
jgi:hypothetical protein